MKSDFSRRVRYWLYYILGLNNVLFDKTTKTYFRDGKI